MSTATKQKRDRRTERRTGNGDPPVPPSDIAGVRRILIAAIRPSKDNPRECPTPESLVGLVESIRAHGILEPILVRPTSEHDERLFLFEVVAGERRYRAAGLAGLTEIPAIVRVLDDRQAREIGAIENLQHEELTPIEEARCYRALLAGPDAPTQEELGKRVGVSQPQICARLALLKLPEKWQRRIGSGEIPPTHARFLAPFRDRPKILKAIEDRIERYRRDWGVGSLADFVDDLHDAARRHTRRLDGNAGYDWRIHRNIPVFTPTLEEREALDVIEILDDGDGEGTVELACNVKLWNKLQTKFGHRFIKEELVKREKERKGKLTFRHSRAAKSDKAPTAAELKAREEAVRKRAKEAAECTARAVADWHTDWLRRLIFEQLEKNISDDDRARLLLYFAASDRFSRGLGSCNVQGIRGHRHTSLARILRTTDAGPKRERRSGIGLPLWPAIAKGLISFAGAKWLQARFWDAEQKGPVEEVPGDDVEQIADYLGVDPTRAWPIDQKTPIGEGYWNLHTKEQLLDLGKELGLHFDGNEKKEQMIRRLMTAAKPLAMPRQLAGKTAGKRRH